MPEPLLTCTGCRAEFVRRSLRCPECGEVGLKHLYKYSRFDEYTLPSLTERTVWFPKVGSLNDPFEFSFALRELHIDGLPIDGASLNAAIEDMKQFGVLSLSQVNDDILMWAHYSSSHTGFCMQFERTDHNEIGSYDKCFPVIYDDDYPSFFLREMEDPTTVARVMTVKARQWAYELEWRMLTQLGNQSYELPGSITGITFGCRMPLAARKSVAAILRDTVEYTGALVSATAYKVHISPLAAATLL